MIYFTSDQHFFYRKETPKVGDRTFLNAEEKNIFLLKQWNETVSTEDQVYILGDLSDGTAEQTEEIIRKLNGEKFLIIGNHDRYLEDSHFDLSVFSWCKQYYELWYQEQKYVLFHFPIEVWSGCGKDRVHVHGHMHSKKPFYRPIRRYDVSVDAHDGKPVSIDRVWNAVKGYHNQEADQYFPQ